jgi:prolyl oligopeptidase
MCRAGKFRGLLLIASLALFAVAFSVLAAAPGRNSDAAAPKAPPVAAARPTADEYFGTKIIDPYRYLENMKDPEVSGWLKAQNEYTRGLLAEIPGRKALLDRIVKLDEGAPARVYDVRGLPSGQYFYQKRLASEDVAKLYTRDGLTGQEKLLVDPTKYAAGGPHYSISYYAPSPDGRYVAFGVAPAGSENAVLRVVDASTAQETGEAIDRTQFGSPAWRPDSRSFYYNRLPQLAQGAQATDQYLKSREYLHVVGRDAKNDLAVFGFGVSPAVKVTPPDLSIIATSPGSPYALGLVIHGVQNEFTLYATKLASLDNAGVSWKKVCDVDDDVTGFDVHGEDLYLLSHKDSPRFKVLHTSLSTPSLAQTDIVVPTGEAVIRNIAAAEDALYVQELDGGVGHVLRVPYGSKPEPVALPFDGTVNLSALTSANRERCSRWPPGPRRTGSTPMIRSQKE